MRHLLLLVLVSAVVPSLPVHAQHLGSRVQWQPETMAVDARLDQPVAIEILGRAAVPALSLLSDATAVSLTVAPEDLNTVGERKLTTISQDLSLKAIMVQLQEALQECHWDIDASGEAPVYLLHRNAGVDQTMEWLEQRDAARRAGQRRAERANRLEEARRALKLSPEELAELEQTDPLLARSVRDAHARDLLEIVLSLPSEQAEQFRETGILRLDYGPAPERLQQAMQRIAAWYLSRWAAEGLPEEVRHWPDHLGHAVITFQDHGVEHGWGVWLSLDLPTESGFGSGIHDVALHPRYCNLDEGQPCYTRLLVATGVADEDAAFQMVIARDKEGFRVDDAKREARRRREWIEPTDPALLQTIVLGDAKFDDFAQLQALIANHTGLPIVSDYFTVRAPYLSDEVRQGLPLWRLLYLIGEERDEEVYLWRKRGDCLVFHRADWPRLAKREFPEWLITNCRARIQDHGEFTLYDLAEIAVILESRALSASAAPGDLQRAGMHWLGPALRWGLLLYASLSPQQRDAIRTPEGLPCSDMTVAQREQVIQRALRRPVPLPREQAQRATFHLLEATEERPGRRFSITKFELRFPNATDAALVSYRRLPEETPAQEGPAEGGG